MQDKAYWRRYYLAHKAERMEKRRLWRLANPAKSKAAKKRWRLRHPEKAKMADKRRYERRKAEAAAYSTQYSREKPEHVQAHRLIRAMIFFGFIVRPDHCSGCGKKCKPDGHHHKGYAKEHVLDVIWLCRTCHNAADSALKVKPS